MVSTRLTKRVKAIQNKNEEYKEAAPSTKRMHCVQTPIYLAKEMGKGMGRSKIL